VDGVSKPAGHIRTITRGEVSWLDVRDPDSDDFAQLSHDFQLHPVHLNESIQKVQHSRVEREEDYLFLVLHFPVYHPVQDKILIGQVGVFLSKDYVITVHRGKSPFIDDLLTELKDSAELEKYFHQGPAYLLHKIISKLLDSISVMTEIVEQELDEIEGLVFENSRSDAQRIGKVRQAIVRLKRLIGPKKMLLQDLADQIDSFTGQNMHKYYLNNVKTVNKLWEGIEEAKETIEIFKDADFTTSTEMTNKTLAILTLIFTFTIPITVVAGLYGMNVPLPGGLDTGAWSFLGTYTTFGFVFVLSALIAVAMYVYFRKKRWF
jgi:magnesium transporter